MSAAKQSEVKAVKISDKGSTRIERGIYRVNYPSHHGIRAYLKSQDTEYQKVFTLAGGEAKALAAAQNPLKKIQSNNKRGIAGVRRDETAWSEVWSAT